MAAPVLITAFNRDPDVVHYGVMQSRTIALSLIHILKRELEIIQPDIIVCGNNLSLLKLVLGEELQNDDTWDNMLALWKDTSVSYTHL